MKTKQYVLDSELKKDRAGLVELSYVYITIMEDLFEVDSNY